LIFNLEVLHRGNLEIEKAPYKLQKSHRFCLRQKNVAAPKKFYDSKIPSWRESFRLRCHSVICDASGVLLL
jgi:hypothetical protein